MVLPTSCDRLIELHVMNIRRCLLIDDFTYVHSSKAHLLHSGQLGTELGHEVAEAIQDMIEKVTLHTKGYLKDYEQGIMAPRNFTVKAPEWIEIVRTVSNRAKASAGAKLGDAANEAASFVRQLPADAQESATHAFLYAFDLVGDLFSVITTMQTLLIENVDDVLKGVLYMDTYFIGDLSWRVERTMHDIDSFFRLYGSRTLDRRHNGPLE
jgi:hypothetical protein